MKGASSPSHVSSTLQKLFLLRLQLHSAKLLGQLFELCALLAKEGCDVMQLEGRDLWPAQPSEANPLETVFRIGTQLESPYV